MQYVPPEIMEIILNYIPWASIHENKLWTVSRDMFECICNTKHSGIVQFLDEEDYSEKIYKSRLAFCR